MIHSCINNHYYQDRKLILFRCILLKHLKNNSGGVRMLAARTARLFLLLSALSWTMRGEETIVGSVKLLQGGAVVHRGTENIPAKEGMHLLLNDVLQTSADARLGIILQDGARVSLGPNTELHVDKFVYQPVEGNFGLVLRLMRGVLAYISGKIAQFSPESVSVETPVGILGLRGTQFAVSLEGP